jgi:hypothetical protein
MTNSAIRKGKYHCYYCGRPSESLDHYVPKARGGGMLGKENIVPACIECNNEKRDMLPEEYRIYRAARHMLATQGIEPVVNMVSWIPKYLFYGESHDINVYPEILYSTKGEEDAEISSNFTSDRG